MSKPRHRSSHRPETSDTGSQPGDTTRRVTTVLVILLVLSLVVHIATAPPREPPTDKPPAATPAAPPGVTPSQAKRDPALPPTLTRVAMPSAEPTNPLDPARAKRYLEEVCALGNRMSGSPGMRAQQELLISHFEPHADQVERQTFKVRNPLGGPAVEMANLIVRWRPEATDRVLLCAHYDTRPLPDRDPNPMARRNGRFIGANDGGSGVAVLMELAHQLAEYEGPLGVDVVLFDGEELVYVDDRDPYFLGSRYFAQDYAKRKPQRGSGAWSYRAGILLDMVGDADLQIYQERFSYRNLTTRPLVMQVWATAQRLGVAEFYPRVRHEVRDDHLALQRFGGIPAIDLIDFDYPAWHTEADVPMNCSGDSLAKVGWVVWEWLLEQREASQPNRRSP
ncbi:M28 family peptidase [Botrimarina hoheduenensis]|uniref:Succinyl-diaminopimelate desuccinylase n=1 Tax=Botrimarina hoheduenensis TaxID=2528000 RepID=A0A5C5W9C6_9BACT|nr:M28 family peptidase [Botrimarina hoheduenensis]TWT46795.1 succinyl-diaminopimelate desuccinylase [Botrimarina hoheduenensis]